MEGFNKACRDIYNEVMGQVSVLEGTEYTEVSHSVKVIMESRFKDLLASIEAAKEVDQTKYQGVEYIERGKDKYRVCGLGVRVAGEGAAAFGAVGVSWGEKLKFNTGMQVKSNVVSKKTSEIWGILVALGVASARKYTKIMVATDHPDYTRIVLKELKDGKLANIAIFEALDSKFKDYMKKEIEVETPNDVEHAAIDSSPSNVIKDAEKIAKKVFEDVKKKNRK